MKHSWGSILAMKVGLGKPEEMMKYEGWGVKDEYGGDMKMRVAIVLAV